MFTKTKFAKQQPNILESVEVVAVAASRSECLNRKLLRLPACSCSCILPEIKLLIS